jgi:hypothetical protein
VEIGAEILLRISREFVKSIESLLTVEEGQKRGPSVRAIIFPTKGVAADRDDSGPIV